MASGAVRSNCEGTDLSDRPTTPGRHPQTFRRIWRALRRNAWEAYARSARPSGTKSADGIRVAVRALMPSTLNWKLKDVSENVLSVRPSKSNQIYRQHIGTGDTHPCPPVAILLTCTVTPPAPSNQPGSSCAVCDTFQSIGTASFQEKKHRSARDGGRWRERRADTLQRRRRRRAARTGRTPGG